MQRKLSVECWIKQMPSLRMVGDFWNIHCSAFLTIWTPQVTVFHVHMFCIFPNQIVCTMFNAISFWYKDWLNRLIEWSIAKPTKAFQVFSKLGLERLCLKLMPIAYLLRHLSCFFNIFHLCCDKQCRASYMIEQVFRDRFKICEFGLYQVVELDTIVQVC